MIGTIVKISLLRLWNSKQELVLIFLVPILFFSIFAVIFSRGVGQTGKVIRISFINDDTSEETTRIIRRALERKEITLATGIGATTPEWPIERLSKAMISRFKADIVVYFPPGFGGAMNSIAPTAVQVLNEGTNPVSSQITQAIVGQAIAIESATKPANKPRVRFASATGLGFGAAVEPETIENAAANVPFDAKNVFATNKHQPKIAMYAAGIAVMFVLFSANGAGASLLEEREAGTLGRLLTSKLTITQLLCGKWVYITLVGFVQLLTMFAWGQLVFGVNLTGHLQGFTFMAVATSAASASFAIFLATFCKSRSQLNGFSIVLVLSMSAVGGSMIPRYIMSDSMQRLSKFTFNGWALDGFNKLFWHDLPVSAIRVEVCVLCSIALLFALASRVFAHNWSKA